jgi:hypothetical protein
MDRPSHGVVTQAAVQVQGMQTQWGSDSIESEVLETYLAVKYRPFGLFKPARTGTVSMTNMHV